MADDLAALCTIQAEPRIANEIGALLGWRSQSLGLDKMPSPREGVLRYDPWQGHTDMSGSWLTEDWFFFILGSVGSTCTVLYNTWLYLSVPGLCQAWFSWSTVRAHAACKMSPSRYFLPRKRVLGRGAGMCCDESGFALCFPLVKSPKLPCFLAVVSCTCTFVDSYHTQEHI